MNKPICILLCILLICLSIVPVFATDYEFTDRSQFCSAFNSSVTWTPTNFTSDIFVDTPSSFSNLINATIQNYNIDTSKIILISLGTVSNTIGVHIIYSDSYPRYGYIQNLTSTGKPNYYCNFISSTSYYTAMAYEDNGNIYYLGNNTSTGSTATISYYGNYRANFTGFIPYHLTVSPTSSYTDFYYLNVNSNSGGGGDDPGQVSFEYITMDKPPSVYTTLSQAFLQAAINRAANQFPSVYNGDTSHLIIDDYNLFALGELIANNTAVFESYTVHSYDFYDNVSYNLAEGMNAIQGAMSNMQNIANNIELLASVYASDQEVEAREAAAENQQTIVDNFLDSEGEGYVSPSDISSVSSMSDGYKTHMSTDAQPSGIWDIFNSNNFGWFSQETVNQLDTTTSNQRGLNTFETPYLDEKIQDIYRSLGVNYDD